MLQALQLLLQISIIFGYSPTSSKRDILAYTSGLGTGCDHNHWYREIPYVRSYMTCIINRGDWCLVDLGPSKKVSSQSRMAPKAEVLALISQALYDFNISSKNSCWKRQKTRSSEHLGTRKNCVHQQSCSPWPSLSSSTSTPNPTKSNHILPAGAQVFSKLHQWRSTSFL